MEFVSDALGSRKQKEAETNAKIVDLFKHALDETKNCRNEQQWVEFGCPGYGKGPWDGLGAMVKTKVTLDITHGKEHTMTGKITSPILVAQHLRATFCTNEWLMEHVDSLINEMVVMYQSAE
jgi:hypothetical protein